MDSLLTDILQQPQALRRLARFYAQPEGVETLSSLSSPTSPVLTGMGASFHAAWIGTLFLQTRGFRAVMTESADLLHYSSHLLADTDQLVFVSQSGASAEVEPILEALPPSLSLIAVTNEEDSPLGREAQVVLPLLVDSETLVANKTYINSLAVLWLLGRAWCGRTDGTEEQTLLAIADALEGQLDESEATVGVIADELADTKTLLFVGHGPHAATAKQAAMMISERVKLPALHASVAAFRHGVIEIAGKDLGVVVFAAPGKTDGSARDLAIELHGYGAKVLVIENGQLADLNEAPLAGREGLIDEFLSPLLDIIPVQLFAEALAGQLGVEPEFRYIEKVVTRL